MRPHQNRDERPVKDAREIAMSSDTCLLCEQRGAKKRQGRLGRYAQTCDACEDRRGSHLTGRSLTTDTGPLRLAAGWVRTGSR
jgi:hypothetical protein